MTNLTVERWYPYALALGSVMLWGALGSPFPVETKEFLAAGLTFGAILIGFVATAQSILMALPAESVIGMLRRRGYLPELVRYIQEALWGLAAFALVNIGGFFVMRAPEVGLPGGVPYVYQIFWIASATAGLCLFQRVTSITTKIMLKNAGSGVSRPRD